MPELTGHYCPYCGAHTVVEGPGYVLDHGYPFSCTTCRRRFYAVWVNRGDPQGLTNAEIREGTYNA